LPGKLSALALAAVLLAPATVPAQGIPAAAVQLAEEGSKALEARKYGEALAKFEEAQKLAPRNASIVFGVGVSLYMLGRNRDAEERFGQALRLNPALLDASLLLGELQYRSGRILEAIATYRAAQKHAPGEARLAAKIAEWDAEETTEKRFAETRGVHFRVRFEGPVDQQIARRAVEYLEAAYQRIGDALRFYPTEPVDVALYTSQQFRDITRGPSWASGVYDGRIRIPVKGALEQADHLERVLVHEYVHALIGGIASRDVPAWVNEGLAVVLEPGGLAAAERVVASTRNRPALAQLQSGFGNLPDAQANIAYAVSAVAARAMLDIRGPSAVLMLLRDLAAGAEFSTAFHQRIGVRYDEFQDTISRR
jgi:tetratricopeptide (TPR) repeat protein